ncbi:hypothetical protein FA95DRAFT_1499315, partial [Auriscalpium vulgare]
PVSVRNHMSTLKHTIRHQQGQLQSLENFIQRAPRQPITAMSPPPSPLPDDYPSTPPNGKLKRRSSYDILHGIAGPESSLPLPRREEGIREGVPMEFGAGPSNKRQMSPTRTLSRIPVSSVGNARALADDGQPAPPPRYAQALSTPGPLDLSNITHGGGTGHSPNTENRRISLTPGGTTRVLADLQTGVINARNALENTKAQLRLSQRSVAQLTRQTEDLKEVRERLRLENEGLNNVVARKERLLQEVLERARKAEAEATTHKQQLKADAATSKKSLRDMETALQESTALSSKSEREYTTLRDSLKDLKEGWRADVDALREEMRRREERWRREAEDVGKKYRRLTEEIKARKGVVSEVEKLKVEDEKVRSEVEDEFREELKVLREEIMKSSTVTEKAGATAEHLSGELARLRRLMQAAGRASTSPPEAPPTDVLS